MRVDGVSAVKAMLKRAQLQYANAADANKCVVVGYTKAYAIHVHENVEMKWRGLPRRAKGAKKGRGVYWGPNGQAKFLEEPARTMRQELVNVIFNAVKRGAPLLKAMTMAGLRLQRASQKLVPVDTGDLRASAFTRVEELP